MSPRHTTAAGIVLLVVGVLCVDAQECGLDAINDCTSLVGDPRTMLHGNFTESQLIDTCRVIKTAVACVAPTSASCSVAGHSSPPTRISQRLDGGQYICTHRQEYLLFKSCYADPDTVYKTDHCTLVFQNSINDTVGYLRKERICRGLPRHAVCTRDVILRVCHANRSAADFMYNYQTEYFSSLEELTKCEKVDFVPLGSYRVVVQPESQKGLNSSTIGIICGILILMIIMTYIIVVRYRKQNRPRNTVVKLVNSASANLNKHNYRAHGSAVEADMGMPPPKQAKTDMGIPRPKQAKTDMGMPRPKQAKTDMGIPPPKQPKTDMGMPPPKQAKTDMGVPLTNQAKADMGMPPPKQAKTDMGMPPLKQAEVDMCATLSEQVEANMVMVSIELFKNGANKT